jgi:hypothetical protein
MAAMAMLQQIRQRNAERERQLMEMQRDQEMKRERAAQTAIQMVQGGADLKKVLTALGADLDEKGRALVEINADTVKRQKKEAEQRQAAQPIIGQVSQLAQQAPNTEAYGQGVSLIAQMLGRDEADTVLQGIGGQAQLAPTMQALQELQTQAGLKQSREQAGLIAQDASRIQQRQQIAVAGAKEQIKDSFAVAREEDKLLAQQVVSGEVSEEQINAAFQGDPFGKIRAQRVRAEAIKQRAALAPMNETVQMLRDNGVPVDRLPKTLIARLTPGHDAQGNYTPPTAFLSPTTGLPLPGKEGGKAQQTVEVLETALHQIDTLEAAARISQENRNNPQFIQALSQQIQSSLNAGLTDGDVSTYYALRNIITPGIARATGEVGNLTEQEQTRAQSVLPSVVAMLTNPKTSRAQFQSARKFLLNRLSSQFNQVYRKDPSIYRDRFSSASEIAIKESMDSYRKEFGGGSELLVEEVQ